MTMTPVRAYLGLGGNTGDRPKNFRQTIALLQEHPNIEVVAISSLYETEPVGLHPDEPAPWFLNGVIAIDTDLYPSELLGACLAIERKLGRIRPDSRMGLEPSGQQSHYQSRPMDIDILFYGNLVIEQAGLKIPHPRLLERAFVLKPLLELAPEFEHPVSGQTIRQLHDALADSPDVLPFGQTESTCLITG